ncbi:MAG: M4 family metallopeptidase [Flavobacteriaceae bacterium]
MKIITSLFSKDFLLIITLMLTIGAFGQKPQKVAGSEIGPTLIVLDQGQSYARADMAQLATSELQLSADSELVLIDQKQDDLGFTQDRYQQYYRGLEVEFGILKVHAKQGQMTAITNGTSRVDQLDVRPTISAQTAFNKALQHVGATRYMWEDQDNSRTLGYTRPAGTLLVLPTIPGTTAAPQLVYKFDIYATAPLYRADVYINAQTGAYVFENKQIHHANTPATGTSLYNGTVSFTADSFNGSYRLQQTVDGGGIQTFDMNNGTNYSNASDITSSGTSFTATSSRTGVQAHYGAEQTHQYFAQKHSRNSYNDNGAVIRSYVSYSSNYVNAFWDGSRMTYGDGDGVNYGPLVSVDIVGHEIAHGVTEYSANLVYSYQSGALNESFSDIFGESIEQYASGNNDWLMGDQIGAGGSGGALRSMSNPNVFGDPDTYLGTNWYSGSGDNGGVHYNSGVQNFWFYLLSTGGTGTNDIGNDYDVAQIGMDKAAAIAYINLATYLSANSQYADARAGSIQAARDLYGEDSPEEIAVTNAWYAVGVGRAYGPLVCAENDVVLTLTTDNYASETSWALTNLSGATIASGSGYSNATTYNITLPNLAADTYFFTINDSYGDGICCAYGSGSYTLTSPQGNIVTGGAFGSSETTEFCVGAIEDTTAPVITLLGDNPVSVFVGQSYTDAGATASDNIDGDITSEIQVTNNVNTANEGSYSVLYNVADAAGNQAETLTRTVNVVPDISAPSIPSGLSASSITTSSFILNWNAATDNIGVTGYEVFLGATSLGIQSGTSRLVNGLTPATGYSLAVRALDQANNVSDLSTPLAVTTATPPDLEAPTAPSALAVSNISTTGLTLTWAASSDNVGVAGYEVFQDNASIGTLSATTRAVIGLSPATTYGYSVRAFDAAGNTSAMTAVLQATTLAPPPDNEAPSVPLALASGNVGTTSFDVSWSASTDNVGVTGYRIYLDGQALGTTSNTNYTVNNLSASTVYNVQVSAYDAMDNESGLSQALAVTTNDPPDTQAPSAPQALGAINITTTGMTLQWNASSDNVAVTGYTLFQNGTAQGNYTSTSAVLSGLASATQYTFAVLAYDAAGNNSLLSTSIQESTLTPPPTCDDGIQNQGETGIDCGGPCAPCSTLVTIHEGYFESSWDDWISGGSDCLYYAGGTYATEGIAAINLQDNSGVSSSMSLSNLNLAAFETVTFSFSYYAVSMENNEDFFVEFNNGSGYQTIGRYIAGIDFPGDGAYSAAIEISNADYNFSANSGFRIRCDASRNNDDVYIDAVVITGDLGGPDVIAPEITLNGSANVTIYLGDAYVDAGATASDNVDGDLTSSIVTTGSVTTGTAGSYSISYDVTDAAGNAAQTARRTVNVITVPDPTCDDGIQNGGETGVDCGGPCVPCATSVTLHEGYFESGWDGWIDGGSDCDRYSGPNSYEGAFSIRLRDNSGAASAMTLPGIDASAHSLVSFSFNFFSFNLNGSEDFFLQVLDSGSWTTLAQYVRGVDFENNTFYSAQVVFPTNALSDASNMTFRLICDASGNNDQIYIDQVLIVGEPAEGLVGAQMTPLIDRTFEGNAMSEEGIDYDDLVIYPNPVKGNLQVKLSGLADDASYEVFSLLGQQVKKGHLTDYSLAVDELPSGLYLLMVNDGEERHYQQFIKE